MTLRASDYWNPFAVFWKPSQTVKDAFELPKMGLAVLLVALPVVLGAVFDVVLGVRLDWVNVATDLVLDWMVWLVVVGVMLAIARAVSKSENTHFNRVATATSLLRVIQTGFVALFFIGLLAFPNAASIKRQYADGLLSYDELDGAVTQLLENTTTMQWAVLGIVLVLLSVLVLWWIYAFYRIVEELFQLTAFKHIVLGVVFLAIWWALSDFLYAVVPI